jgi:hypothetical protein
MTISAHSSFGTLIVEHMFKRCVTLGNLSTIHQNDVSNKCLTLSKRCVSLLFPTSCRQISRVDMCLTIVWQIFDTFSWHIYRVDKCLTIWLTHVGHISQVDKCFWHQFYKYLLLDATVNLSWPDLLILVVLGLLIVLVALVVLLVLVVLVVLALLALLVQLVWATLRCVRCSKVITSRW